jgi:hypothetical protein
MSSQMFSSNIYLSSELTGKMVNVAQELALRVVRECGNRYNFDADEAIEALGLSSVEVVHSSKGRASVSKKERNVVVKASFALPFNGEYNDSKCCGLRQNNGLYTQCQVARKGEKRYCKTCDTQASKNDNGKPDYGTIEDRLAVGIYDYVDPRGNKPVGYKKIMKKLKITEEQVLEEAGKLNIIINPEHFQEVEEPRRGRKSNPLKEVKVKAEGKKGRPKKTKKVLEIEGESEDLFASLVAVASSSSSSSSSVSEEVGTPVLKVSKKVVKSEEEKEAEKAAKEAEKEAKLAAKKAEKEAKLAAEKAEKEAKLAAEKAEKEAKMAAEKAKKEAEKEAKAAKKKPTSPKKEVKEEEEADVVKKIEFEGKKYLKSKKTGIVYDYKKYVEEEEQVVVGKWNEEKSKIEFDEKEEEEEEEYEE